MTTPLLNATLFKARLFAAVSCGLTTLHAADIAELTVSSDTDLATPLAYSGEGFIATTPNSSAAHRNAVVVINDAVLTLASGAQLQVANDDNNTTFLRVGYHNTDNPAAGTGHLVIESGATLQVGQSSRYANFMVGEGEDNTGTVDQNGGDVTILGSFNLGIDGGQGTYVIDGGTLTIDHADDAGHTTLATLGLNLNLAGPDAGTSGGELVINGGTVNILAHEYDPVGNPGAYGSTALILGNRDRGAASYGEGNGTLTQNGGVLHVDNHANLFLSSVGDGAYNLNGGVLEIGGTSLRAKYGNGPGTYAFNLGGGTLRVTGSDLTTSVDATLVDGTTSTIDTAGLDATISGDLTGTGSLEKIGDGELALSGAANAFGTLSVQGGDVNITGGSTQVTRAFAGSGTDADGRLVVSGGVFSTTGSANSNLRTTYIGTGAGNTGEFLLTAGTVNIGLAATPSVRADFEVGSFSATGTATQTGGALVLNSTGGYFHIGNQGTGVYNLEGGSITVQNAFVLGRSTLAYGLGDGTLNISGGTLTLASATKGALIVGGVDATGSAPGGKGLINQTGGTVRVGQYLELGTAGGDGTYNLSGGTLEVGGTSGIRRDATGTYAFNFGGGTLRVTGADLTTAIDYTLVPGTTSVIDTNGLNATFSGDLTAPGLHQVDFGGHSLVKAGAGTLTFSGASAERTLDTFAVTEGTVDQTAGDTTAVEFMTGTGDGNAGAFVMDGGTLTVGPSTRADNVTVVAGSFRVGDFGGTGTFTQNAGTVTMLDNTGFNIGNQGGTGIYNLAGGTLELNAGLHVLGRSTVGKPASDGTLNISGGLLVLDNGGSIINGNNTNTEGTELGTGEINQTGGTVRITDGTLYVAGFGDGTYNLSGGTLEVGGDDLRARYNNTNSANSEFNFGDGIIKVIGSDLTTDVVVTLVDGTTATIDTNALNAAFTKNITGTGTLLKTGAGTLTLSGTNAFRTLAGSAGTLTNGTGTTTVRTLAVAGTGGATYALTGGTLNVRDDATNGEMTVGGGAGNSGTFNISGGTLNVGNATHYGRFFVGAYDGTGVANQTGGTVNASGPFHLGNRGGDGTYNLTGGLLNVGQYPASGDSNAFILGRSRTGQQVNGSVGRLNVGGTGHLVLNTNTPLLIGGDYGSEASLSEGRVDQTGGTVTVNSKIDIGSSGHGEYNLSGGVLEIGGANTLVSTSGDYALNLGGGTIKVTGSSLSTALRGTLVDGTVSTINTNGLDATFTDGLDGTGGFAKTGVGALTLNGVTSLQSASTVSGLLRIGAGSGQSGTLNLSDELSVVITNAVGRLQVGVDGGNGTANFGEGASFIIDDADKTSGWGTLDVGRGAGSTGLVNHTAGLADLSGGALQIAYSGATGTYHLSGDAELALGEGSSLFLGSGADADGLLTIADDAVFSSAGQVFVGAGTGATGTITQTGGSATFTGTTVWFGTDSDETTGAPGTGTYNLSAGTLVFDGVDQGVRFGDHASGGSGVFNQSGGVATLANTTLKVGAHGAYNQSGGTLEVGGANLTGSGAYNLGGGTIKVTGSALSTGMNATLTADRTLTIDTNNLGATFTGGFNGAGILRKTGLGTMRVTGQSDHTGDTLVEQGVFDVDGTLAASHVRVSSGARLTGDGTLADATLADGATLAFDDAEDSLEFTGDLTLAATTQTLLGVLGESEFNRLVVGGTLFADGVLEITFLDGFVAAEGTSFDFIDGTIDGTFAAFVMPTLGAGLAWNYASFYTDGVLSVVASSVVPEPATFGALLGTLTLALAALRRRQRA